MEKNQNLKKAKDEKNDEYFTRTEDIELEVRHYLDEIRGKRIICNCNDYPGTPFFDYFVDNFNKLELKSVTGFKYNENGNGMKFVYEGDLIYEFYLNGNGGFESNELLECINDNTIVITNPPFSKFTDYINKLMERKAKFLIIGSINAATSFEIFPFIKENRVWLGSGDNHLSMWFGIPDYYERSGKSLFVGNDGKRYWKVCGTVWYTNLKCDVEKEKIELKCSINKENYETIGNTYFYFRL